MQLIDTRQRYRTTAHAAGVDYDVVMAPRPQTMSPWRTILLAARSVLQGMRTTLHYLVRPSTTVTQQYPENRDTLVMHERYRAKLEFLSDDGFHRCTACRICERECPNTSIIIDASKGPLTKKWEVDRYVWRLDTCTFCNICVQVCPFEAIDFSGKFESSVYDRRLLLFNLNEYAGPHASLAEKVVPDAAERAKLKRTCDPYTGDLPLNGGTWAGIPALPGASRVKTSVVEAPVAASAAGTTGVADTASAPDAPDAAAAPDAADAPDEGEDA